ncbi:MAG TPA: translocation/assembly module TamB domain-containing protein [Polyangiaceae bacterium]
MARSVMLRAVGRVLGGFGLILVFVSASAVGVVLHLNLAASRECTEEALSSFLSDLFVGRIEIEALEALSSTGLRVGTVSMYDASEARVLKLSGLRVRADLIDLLTDLLFAAEKATLTIRHVRVDRAEVELIPDPKSGKPTLAHAFELAAPPSPTTTAPETYVRVWLPVIEVGNAYGRGQLGGSPTLEVHVSGARGSVLASPRGAAVDVERFGMVARGWGGADAQGVGSVHVRAPGAVWGSFDGFFGELGLSAFVRVDGNELHVVADVPRARPDSVRVLWPEWPVLEDASVRVELDGKLPVLDASATVKLDSSEVVARGPVTLSGDVGADLDVTARAFDLAAVLKDAPATAIDARANFVITARRGRVSADGRGVTEPTEIAGYSVPAAEITGHISEIGFNGRAELQEPGMPFATDVSISSRGVVDLSARIPRFELARAPRIAKVVDANGSVEADVTAHIEDGFVDAKVHGNLARLEQGPARLEAGRFELRARGRLSEPERLSLEGSVDGTGLTVADFSFERVGATARGQARQPRIELKLTGPAGLSLGGAARLTTVGKPRLDDIVVDVARGNTELHAKLQSFVFAEDRLLLENLAITGAGGNLTGSVRIEPRLWSLQASGDGLDLARIADLLGAAPNRFAGTLRLNADVTSAHDFQGGRLDIGLTRGTLFGREGIDAELSTTLNREDLRGTLTTSVPGVARAEAQWETSLAGPALEASSFYNLTGRATLAFTEIDLALLQRLGVCPPWDGIAGTGELRVRLERSDPTELPNAIVVAQTRNLHVVVGPCRDGERIELDGIDVQVGGGLDGTRGDVSGTVRLFDGGGTLASMSGALRVEWLRVLAHPERLGELLANTPMTVMATVPPRPLSSLPEPVRVEGLDGDVGGRLAMSGTLNAPVLNANVELQRFRGTRTGLTHGVDVNTSLQYRWETREFGGRTEIFSNGKRVAWGVARGELKANGVLELSDWKGSAELALEGLPLDLFEPLAEAKLGGGLRGAVSATRNEGATRFSANLELEAAAIEGIPLGRGEIELEADQGALSGRLALEHARGRLDARVNAGLEPRGDWFALRERQPILISLDARNFDAVILSPVVRDLLSDLSGEVTGHLRASLSPVPRSADDPDAPSFRASLDGQAHLTHGRLEIDALGFRIDDADVWARAVAEPDGSNRIEVAHPSDPSRSGLSGKVRSERRNFWLSADIGLDGFELDSVRANLAGHKIPVVVDGVTLAEVTTGQRAWARVQIERKRDEMWVTLHVPELVAELPRSSQRSLLEVERNPEISVLQPLGEPEVADSGAATPWTIQFLLGDRVRVTQAGLDIPITGDPVLSLDHEALVTGTVNLTSGGALQVLGKPFSIEHGRVLFDTGENDNPRLEVTAAWRSAEGTKVVIDVRGTLKDPTFRWTTDPPVAADAGTNEQAAKALLLGSGTGGSAATTAAGQVAEALNQLLSETPIQVRATTEGSAAAPPGSGYGESSEQPGSYATIGARYRISDQVWLEGVYKREEGALQSDQDVQEGVGGALEYRFLRNWSLRTELGQLGAGLDLLWQYRY